MPKITTARLNELRDILDESLLTSSAYEIVSNDGDSSLVGIVYKDNLKFCIELSQRQRQLQGASAMRLKLEDKPLPSELKCRVLPGEVLELEEFTVESFDLFCISVEAWAERIDKLIRFPESEQEERKAFEKKLKSQIDANVKDDKATFTVEEKERIYEMLRELRERCAALEREKKITPQEYSEIEATCVDMAKAADTMPKKSWLRAMGSKIYVYGRKALFSKPGQIAMGEAAKQLVDEAPNWLQHL